MSPMRVAIVVVLCALVVAVRAQTGEEAVFMLFTDFHVDPYYEWQYNPDSLCRNSTIWPVTDDVEVRVPDAFFTHRPSNADLWESLTPEAEGQWVLPNFNYGQYDCDAPIALVEAAIFEAKRLVPDPDFIIFTGDMSAHHLPTWGTRTLAITDGFSLIADSYPGVPVYPTLGNNDLFPDYFIRDNEIIGDNRWFQNIWNIWDSTVGMPADQESTFVNGGYFSTIAANHTLMISLNTITLCPCRSPDEDDSETDPFGQMAWFEDQLTSASEQGLKVYIIGHIAPIEGYWYATYLQVFNSLVAQFSDIILAQFFAHNHSDQFHAIFESNSVDPSNTPAGTYVQSPSITPKDGNNPGFRVVSYDRTTFATLDYWQYYMDLLYTQATSKAEFVLEYQFTTLYQQEFYNNEGVYGALQMMAKDRKLYSAWHDNKHTQYDNPDDIMGDICELRENTYFGYLRCMLQGLPWVLKTNGLTPGEASPDEVLASLRMHEDWADHPNRDQGVELVAEALQDLAQLLA